MIVVLKPGLTAEEIHKVVERIESFGLRAHLSEGKERTIIGAIGDERLLVDQTLESFPGVEKVLPILKPYKLVSREFQKTNTIIEVNSHKIGGKRIHVMAGPCSVESRDQVLEAAIPVKEAGGTFLRGGAFKPRTSPYSFQGLAEEGLGYLAHAREVTGLPVITEVLDPRDLDVVCRYTDILQIGARNMQNFKLLTEVGKLNKPVMLKRGMSATIQEFLLSAEYIAAEGNRKIILCERGIRTYESETRNTLDLSAVPVLKQLSHLPVFVDPSHGTGRWDLVTPMALAGIAAGADGLLIEVHSHPEVALSDGPQSLKPNKFAALMREARKVAEAIGREI
ncbi:MAG: 3-deoxy-7-phosphoheptulonate synthase [Deltaproteobacteria bacterium]|nr:3-deoxy-7-phosphoheptulonate synthase [Deltaproteobacteria bacterium]MBI2209660.1 3-deoxy-7-phosphoheptulonate synthase [Deltaproteobacteria bacterium]